MRIVAGLTVGAALLIATAAAGQKTPDVAEVSIWKLKAGATPAVFEAGRKKHMEFHAAQKDAFGWMTWEIVNGDRAGSYLTGTFGHYWKDFDGREAFDALDGADVARTTGAQAEVDTTGYWIYMSEVSREPAGATGPAAFAQLTHYMVNPADVPRFEDALKEIKPILDTASWPVHSSWYRLASGGEGPHYVLSTRRDNWAAFAPVEKSLIQVLTDSIGARRAAELLDTIRSSTREVYTEVLKFRSDLSYAPAAK